MFDKNYQGAAGPLLVLALLAQEDLYGYEIIRRLEQRSEQAFRYQEGTLYPVLHRLEKEGAVKSYEKTAPTGRVRKYYALTPKGRRQLAAETAQFSAFHEAVGKVLKNNMVLLTEG